MDEPTTTKPFYTDPELHRNKHSVLLENDIDPESLSSTKSRFIFYKNGNVCVEYDPSSSSTPPQAVYFTREEMERLEQRLDIQLSQNDNWMFVGERDGMNYWAVPLDGVHDKFPSDIQSILKKHVKFTRLRNVGDQLDRSNAAILATANGLSEFHRTHPFCNKCGHPTHSIKAGSSRKCTNCLATIYPRIDTATIMLITSSCDDYALMGRKKEWPKGRYSTLAGFAEIGETLEECVVREVWEESGVKVNGETLRFVASQPWPFPRSLMVGFRGQCHPSSTPPPIDFDKEELEDVQWFQKSFVASRLEGGSTALTYEPTGSEAEFHIPGRASLARVLIKQWVGEGGS